MSIAYIKPLFLHLDQMKNNINERYDEINIKDLSEEDKLFLFDNILPIIGNKENFVKNEFFEVIKSVDKTLVPLEIWDKYTTIKIKDIIDFIKHEDDLFNDSVKKSLIDKLINLALEKKIYSFRQDW